ncbi:radical SAM/SPASM domain-containing protein [Tepidibacter thalassicus]|uniref:Radical SAM additional 4Fe4S-binding SPASM domain-containing protein n=1 Tax=Tepidibacter thalassicus DSM 15285 TaxID=1123350 RepID=A0A1M5SY23_9FIRM|nr:radical SAM protein [Tepidibacter thalassicus]SHH43382.1 radical SAM additional 4Fe4S-binding SPASM domain-containing protein [Tepidibacter thalassicus DSM 15285]
MEFMKFPLMVGWAITNKCNLNCLYCSQDSGEMLDEELSFEEAKMVIDQLAENKISVIGFTGGEPLLKKELPDIVRYANSKNIRCQVTTNGLLIANGYPVEYLSRFIKVRISLDSNNRETHDYLRNQEGCYDKVIKAVDRLKRIGMQVEIVTTISTRNIDELDSIIEFVKDLNIDQWSVSTFCPIGRGSEISSWMISAEQYRYMSQRLWEIKDSVNFLVKTDIPQLVLLDENRLKSENYIYCAAATELLVIFPNGDLAPCFSMPLSAGNVRTDKIYDVWNNSKLFNDLRNKELLTGKCGDCEYINACGGCRAMAYAKYGDFLTTDPICWKE